MGRLDGKVAFITGAARGQGRATAIRLAQDGADIIAVDICRQLDSVPYPLATPEDLEQTVKQIEALDRRVVASHVDVRDAVAVQDALTAGVHELGRVDIVAAIAGISALDPHESDPLAIYEETLAINLTGVRHTVHAAVPTMIEQGDGGAIVMTGSTLGLTGRSGNGTGAMDGYVAAKAALVGLMKSWAHWLAPHHIRVNTVHPTACRTPMVTENLPMIEFLSKDPIALAALQNLLPVDLIEPEDMANATAFLVSDDARYITGLAMPVDAGHITR